MRNEDYGDLGACEGQRERVCRGDLVVVDEGGILIFLRTLRFDLSQDLVHHFFLISYDSPFLLTFCCFPMTDAGCVG